MTTPLAPAVPLTMPFDALLFALAADATPAELPEAVTIPRPYALPFPRELLSALTMPPELPLFVAPLAVVMPLAP